MRVRIVSLGRTQGKYDEAKQLIERSLRIQETNLGEHHPDVAHSLNNLANLLSDHVIMSFGMVSLARMQGKYDEAKPLYERSLRIQESIRDEHHLDIASSLNNLATTLKSQVFC